MEKVKLPREVAGALKVALKEAGGDAEYLAWHITNREYCRKRSTLWEVLHEFANKKKNFFLIIDALRYGYEIEPEPITVTITPEMQEEIKACFKSLAEDYGPSGTMAHTFVRPLEIIGIQIPGVNA